jgi:ribosomal 30S subunit maturation factor RimM
MAPLSHPVPEGYRKIGTLGKTFKLAGGLRFYGLGQAEQAVIVNLKEVFVPPLGVVALKRVEVMSRQTVIYLAGVLSVEAAKRLANQPVYALRTDLPGDADGYVEALIGRPVLRDGQPFGVVRDLLEVGGQRLLVVSAPGAEYLVPLAADYVTVGDAIDIRNPPEGLFEPA